MARRIVYAEKSGFHSNSEFERALFVDRWIEIDWKPKVFIDSWTGDVESAPPSYKVGLASRTFEGNHPTLLEYGTIKNPEDVAWVKGATHGSYMAGSVRVEEVKDVVVRVHQIGLQRDGRQGFEIEILTGEDAKTLIDKAKREQAIGTFKEVWWLVPIGIAVLWWLL
ncbi:hypothetical protein [Sphingomonas sp.]|uniref:hypothetical protein n=1 Tax=Sphingomonas sp. TaxID=28214 RepID=UPI0035B0E000